MPDINYAEKYEVQVDERFKLTSVTESAVNRNYNFDGVNKINIYSVETAPLNDYDRESASNRYGTAKELGNAVQSLTLMQDSLLRSRLTGVTTKIRCLQTVRETLYKGRLTRL